MVSPTPAARLDARNTLGKGAMMQRTRGGAVVRRALIVDSGLAESGSAATRSVRALVAELNARKIEVVEALSCEDGRAVVASDAGHPLHPAQLDAGRQRRQHARAGDRAAARRASAQREGADLPDGEPQARGHRQRRGRDARRRVHLDPRRHGAVHRRARAEPRSSATSRRCCRRSPPRWRATTASASTPGPRPATRAASHS